MLEKYMQEDRIEVGIDEAGRGPLFGRVYTAAVILPNDNESFDYSCIKDSKLFHSKKKINKVCEYIKQTAVSYSISYIDEKTIDKVNILESTIRSMHNCIDTLSIKPEHILVDGNYFKPYCHFNHDKIEQISHTCVTKGDNTYASIAAASILAKCARDAYIEELCESEPELNERYHLCSNKGYGTKQHIDGIREFGLSIYHRKSFCKRFV